MSTSPDGERAPQPKADQPQRTTSKAFLRDTETPRQLLEHYSGRLEHEQSKSLSILDPRQAAARFEWRHLMTNGHEDEKTWEQVQSDFRKDSLIASVQEWERRSLTEGEFWNLVFHQGPTTAPLYDASPSRLLVNIAQKAESINPADDEFLTETEKVKTERHPLAAPFEDEIVVRPTHGDSETDEHGSFYIHDGNHRMLNYARHLLETDEPYIPVHALVGTGFAESNPDALTLQSAGPLVIEGYKGRESVPQEEILNTFAAAEQLYFTFPPKIGDIAMGTGFLHGIVAMEKAMDLPPKEKIVMAPVSMHVILAPTCEALGIRLMQSGGDLFVAQNRAEFQAREIDNKTAVIFELDSTGGGNPEGLYFGHGQLTIKNILPSLIDRYAISEVGPSRQRLYIADMFGIDPNLLDPRDTLPKLDLAYATDEKKQEMIKKYNIDTNNTQVAINIETSEAGRQYSIENWCEAARLIKSVFPDVEFNIIYDPNKRDTDETFIDRDSVMQMFSEALSEGDNSTTIRMVAEPLQDLLQFMRTQDVLVSNDTGIPHLVAVAPIKDMPEVVDLFTTPDADPDKWVSTPRIKPLTPPQDETTDKRGGIYCTDPALKWINKIDPQNVAGQAIAAIFSRKVFKEATAA